jgi:hypothetical protein
MIFAFLLFAAGLFDYDTSKPLDVKVVKTETVAGSRFATSHSPTSPAAALPPI